MKKRILSLFTVLILLCLTLCPAYAAADNTYVIDQLGVLTASELIELNEEAKTASQSAGVDIAVMLMQSCGGLGPYDYAASISAGMGYSENCAILVCDDESGNYAVYTAGLANSLLSKNQIDAAGEAYNLSDTYTGGIEDYIDYLAGVLPENSSAQQTTDTTGGTAVVPETGAADAAGNTNPAIPTNRIEELLVDEADLLSSDEEASLLSKLTDISERQQCEVAIVTVNSLEGKTAQAYADDFYDYNGYGYGAADDGILFLLSMGERQWAITTYGYGIPAFTDAGQEYIMEQVTPLMSDGSFNDAFNTFADDCDAFITQAKTGTPYDYNNLPKGTVSPIWIPGSLLIGALIAFISLIRMKGQLKTVGMLSDAAGYVDPGSLTLIDGSDVFMYRNIQQVRKPEKESGGSSTHTSSSGRSHGGSSGSF